MSGLTPATAALWAGILALSLAFGTLAYLILKPGPRRLPLERRRPGADPEASPLARLAEKTTVTVERLISGRGGGFALTLERAGVKTPLRELVILLVAAALAAAALGLLLRGVWLALVLVALVPVIARLVLAVLTSRRRKAFADQLDGTLQMLAGSLRAGYSLLQAVSAVSTEAEGPTDEEFARVINETRVGRPLGAALEDCARRVGSEDFYWVTQAITINREIGGNLADVLDGVGRTIRERSALRRQVSALSAEGRLSAIILMALPFVLILLIGMGNPDYLGKLTESFLGWAMIVTGGVLLAIGGLWLRKSVEIKY